MKEQNLIINDIIPEAWLAQLYSLAEQREISITDLLQEAIATYLGINISSAKILVKVETLQQELATLKDKVTAIESSQHYLKSLSFRLDLIEQMQAPSSKPESFSEPNYSPESEDYDDEPDEILTDFLYG